MALDFGQIKTEVESFLLDLPSGASSRVGGWINEAIKDASKRRNYRFMESELNEVTTDQQRLIVAKPADWKEARIAPYLVNQDGSTTEIDWAPSEADMVRTYAKQLPDEGNAAAPDEGQPRYVLETATELHCYPLPDDESDWDNGLYRIRLPYWAFPAALVNDTDTNEWTDNGEYYCIFKAASIGFAWNRDEERANYYDAQAERAYQRFERWYKMSNVPDRLNLAIRPDAFSGKSRSGNRG